MPPIRVRTDIAPRPRLPACALNLDKAVGCPVDVSTHPIRLLARRLLLSVLVAWGGLSACETPAARDRSGLAPAPIVTGSTYAWGPRPESVADPRLYNASVLTMVQTAVESSLARKGYRRVARVDQADLKLLLYVALRDLNVGVTYSYAAPMDGLLSGAYGSEGPQDVKPDFVAAMVLVVYDAESGGRLLRTAASGRVVAGQGDKMVAVAADELVMTLPQVPIESPVPESR